MTDLLTTTSIHSTPQTHSVASWPRTDAQTDTVYMTQTQVTFLAFVIALHRPELFLVALQFSTKWVSGELHPGLFKCITGLDEPRLLSKSGNESASNQYKHSHPSLIVRSALCLAGTLTPRSVASCRDGIKSMPISSPHKNCFRYEVWGKGNTLQKSLEVTSDSRMQGVGVVLSCSGRSCPSNLEPTADGLSVFLTLQED
ncbi:hypothetical protein PAAG_07071 [Paracoccidioides lutzii Pb01]|uniref:Uncharacterized protein n=1 Tax=Paracoccidioides lutzii (strain ATCC MYA-826 / Pb01) TaxID=502779 RepID=C1H894_PARBA|nr:hypothetical protein PAAG_07071 [Paracoccidioides lutzii Pb01]EEH36653.2 hypothetical protein PAAG_07071 [Paracoccidioides lutzii Pb01]